MKTNTKSACSFAFMGLLLALALTGATGCSDDNPSDSTPDLFTPAAGTTSVTAPYRLRSVLEAPMPSKGATLYLIDVKMDLKSLGKEADSTRYAISECLVSVSYDGQELVSGTSLSDEKGVSRCLGSGDDPDHLGAFLVGTPKKSGSMTFSIKMYEEDNVTVKGSTAALPVQPGQAPVEQELVATPVL
jgi:hypothetical protein